MKPNPWIYPALAVIGVGCWISYQKHKAATIGRDISILNGLTHELAAREVSGQVLGSTKEKANLEKIDWRTLSKKFGQTQNGSMLHLKEILRLQRALIAMTSDELIAQFYEMDALQLPENIRFEFANMLLTKLGEKNPELVLQRFTRHLNDPQLQWPITAAWSRWAENDPQAATAWFNQQIAAGTFDSKTLDGKNATRIQLERVMVNALVKNDSQAAITRVMALPEDQRSEIFSQNIFVGVTPPQYDANYVSLIRNCLSPEKAGHALVQIANNLSGDRLDQFIVDGHFSDAEKTAIVNRVVMSQLVQDQTPEINRETLEKLHTWATLQSPTTAESVTGEALAQSLWSNKDFSKTTAFILEYQQRSGSDAILVSFLQHRATQERAAKQAQSLISHIKDPVLRAKIQSLPAYQSE